MSLTREELIRNLKDVKKKEYGKEYLTFQTNVYQMASDILDYLENENTESFKHFKMYSDSTFRNMNKDDLIEFIHILYHNWGAIDLTYKNVAKENERLKSQLYEYQRKLNGVKN